jgi:YD repeat-containing protein
VNLASLTLFARSTDLIFGGTPGFSLERSFNSDDTAPGPFGIGWASNVTESLTPDGEGNLVLRRASGRLDQFAAAVPGATTYVALTTTTDTLNKNSDGTFTLRTPGSTVARAFTSDGRLLSIQDSGTPRVSLDYDSSARLSAARYRGRKITFSYDSNGRISSASDTAGRSVSYSYSVDGHLAQQTNADGSTVSYQYDGSGNLVSIGATTVTYAGDPGYMYVSSVTTADGVSRQYDLPQSPTQIRRTNGSGDAAMYVSNAAGLLQSVTDANGNRISYTYDAAGHRTSAVNGAGETAKFTYDSNGNLTGVTDAGGNRWLATYTTVGLAQLTDANGNIWAFKYDASGNLVAVTNPASGTISATRSASEQITGTTDTLGNQKSFQYSSDGLITTFTDALGEAWSYQYDGAANASSRTDPGGATLSAAYTANSQISSLTAGNATFNYDFSNNPLTYSYDAAGQLTGLTMPGGKKVTYQYDHAGRLVMVTDWLGNFAAYRYDAAGYPVSISISGGPLTIYQYDLARRLRAILSTGPDGSPVAGYRYTVDANGNRTGVSALDPSTAPAPVAAYVYQYDAAGQPLSRGDGEIYKYDARSNLASIQGGRNLNFTYDSFGRLQSIGGDNSTMYSYDSTGRRSVRVINGKERDYVYDASGGRPRVVMETDGSGATVAWYVYGLGLLWKVTADGTPYFYHFDGDGNVVAVSTPAKGVVNQYRYDPAGLLISANEGVENSFHAHGESGWIDDGNGLIYTGSGFLLPDLRLTLPSMADPAPPNPALAPQLSGAGSCFLDGVAACALATGRRVQ